MSNTMIALALGGFVSCYVFIVLGLVARAVYFPKSADEIPDFHCSSNTRHKAKTACENELEYDYNAQEYDYIEEADDRTSGSPSLSWSVTGGYCPDGIMDEDGNMAAY